MFAVFIVNERQSLIMNSSLIYANIVHDMTQYSWDPKWVAHYNEAIWKSNNGQYSDAKKVLSLILNDATVNKKAEVSELYGDLIYSTSGSLDDVIRMYDRSLSSTPSERVTAKIAYIKMIQQQSKIGSGTTEKSPLSHSGSTLVELKKIELKKTAWERDKYLGNATSSAWLDRGDLERLIERAQSSWSTTITQDW